MKNKKIILLLLCFILTITLFISFKDGNVNADGLVTYNANEWDTFKNRTKEEIGKQYQIATNTGSTYRDGDSSTYYKVAPSLSSPYVAGELTDDTHQAMTAMTNYYRWLIGVNSFTSVSSHSDDLQAGALIRNWDFAHSVSSSNKPEDMDDSLWEQGASAAHNILAMGYTPRGSITAWLNEGYNLSSETFDTLGHRTALLAQNRGGVTFGYSGSIAIGLASSGNTSTLPYYAFPAAGLMPYNGIIARVSAWNIELNTSVITNANSANVIVSVTNLNTDETYDCTVANGKLQATSSLLTFAQPASSSTYYAEGDKYKVEVTGLSDVSSSNEASIIYTTEFFDVTQYAATIATGYNTIDGWSNLILTSKWSTTETLNKIASILPTTISVETENGREASVSVSGEWILDEENNCWTNSVDKNSFPDYLTDPDGVLDTVKITYEIDDEDGSKLYVNSTTPTEGDSGYFRMWRYLAGSNRYKLYQVVSDGVGYKSIERFNQDSENITISDSGYIYFNIDAYELSDTGTYIGIYYMSSIYDDDAYLAGSLDVNVTEKEVKSISVTSPDKNTYKVGEELDVTGGKVNITYVDNTTSSIDLTKDMVSNFSSDASGEYTATVTYRKTATFNYLIVANPDDVDAEYGDTLADVNLPKDDNGVYSWQDVTTTSVGEIGTKTFKVIYTPNDSSYSTVSDLVINVNVNKGNPSYSTLVEVNATYGDTLADVELPTSDIGVYEFEQLLSLSVGNAGVNTKDFTVKFTPYDSDKYKTVTSIPVKLTVEKAIPSYTVPTNIEAGYGDILKDVALPTGFSWSDESLSVGNVGEKSFTATFTPEDTDNYKIVSDISITVNVGKTTPEYVVPTDLTATYGDTLEDVALPSSDNGVYSWEDSTLSVGNAGENTFVVIFTPNDTDNYRTVTIDVNVTVEKAVPNYTVPTGLSTTYGKSLSNISLPVAENGVYSWEDSTLSVGDVGENTFVVIFTPNDTNNYKTIENINTTVLVEKANPSYEIPSDLSAVYGNTLADVILPQGFSWKNSEASVGEIGTNYFEAYYTPTDTFNYNIVTVNIPVAVTKAIPSYVVPTDLTATYGDTLASVTLPLRDNGYFEFEDLLSLSVGAAGEHTFSVRFIPDDTDHYEIIENITVSILVNKKVADTVEIPVLSAITYDPEFKLSMIALPDGWSWDDPDTVPTVENEGYKATYTPNDPDNYDYSSQNLNPSLELTVNKAIPDYDAPVVVAYYGETLNDTELPIVTNGTFTWQDSLTTSVGEIGSHNFKVTFTPNDSKNYEIVTDIIATVEVGKSRPTYTLPTGITATYGDKLSDIQLPDGFTWSSPDTSVGSVGEKVFLATYTPEDTENYATITNIEISVSVQKKVADPITIPDAIEITYDPDVTLSDIALPNGWSWDDPTIVPTVANSGYKATYTPSDIDNYDYSSQNLNPTIEVNVNKANPSYTSPDSLSSFWGDDLSDISLPEGFSWQDSGSVGEIGEKTFKLIYTPSDTENYNVISDIEVLVTVNKAILSVTIPEDVVIDKVDGMLLSDISLPDGWSWSNPDTVLVNSGEYEVVFVPEDTDHYEIIKRKVLVTLINDSNLSNLGSDDFESIYPPKTYDDIAIWFSLAGVSLVAIIGIIFNLKKQRQN